MFTCVGDGGAGWRELVMVAEGSCYATLGGCSGSSRHGLSPGVRLEGDTSPGDRKPMCL